MTNQKIYYADNLKEATLQELATVIQVLGIGIDEVLYNSLKEEERKFFKERPQDAQ